MREVHLHKYVQVFAQAAREAAPSAHHSTLLGPAVLDSAPDPDQVATDKRLVARERMALEQRNIILPAQCALTSGGLCMIEPAWLQDVEQPRSIYMKIGGHIAACSSVLHDNNTAVGFATGRSGSSPLCSAGLSRCSLSWICQPARNRSGGSSQLGGVLVQAGHMQRNWPKRMCAFSLSRPKFVGIASCMHVSQQTSCTCHSLYPHNLVARRIAYLHTDMLARQHQHQSQPRARAMQKTREAAHLERAAARKRHELAKTPLPMILTRIAQILGSFSEISSQATALQKAVAAAMAAGPRSSAAGSGLSAEVLSRVAGEAESAMQHPLALAFMMICLPGKAREHAQ